MLRKSGSCGDGHRDIRARTGRGVAGSEAGWSGVGLHTVQYTGPCKQTFAQDAPMLLSFGDFEVQGFDMLGHTSSRPQSLGIHITGGQSRYHDNIWRLLGPSDRHHILVSKKRIAEHTDNPRGYLHPCILTSHCPEHHAKSQQNNAQNAPDGKCTEPLT